MKTSNNNYISVKRSVATYILKEIVNDINLAINSFFNSKKNLSKKEFYNAKQVINKLRENVNSVDSESISFSQIFDGVSKEEEKYIEDYNIREAIIESDRSCEILDIPFFDVRLFLKGLDVLISEINLRNLQADDDYQKKLKFCESIKSDVESSNDPLKHLALKYSYYNDEKYINLGIDVYGDFYSYKKLMDEVFKVYIEQIKEKENIRNKMKKYGGR